MLEKRLKIGLSHGLFDLLHPGHIFHLNEAKKHCDILIVRLVTIFKKKFNGPYYKELQRKIFLSNLDVVILFTQFQTPQQLKF